MVGGLLLAVVAAPVVAFLLRESAPLLGVAMFAAGCFAGASFAGIMQLASPETPGRPTAKGGNALSTGEVKWFRGSKGFGFIVPDDGGDDCFVHRSAIEGGQTLSQGDRVSYVVTTDAKGRVAADRVKKLGS
jgi:CspA family cold shock protein